MNDPTDLAHQDPAQIEEQIQETRSAITEKLEALEEQVRETVETARESVEETISTVKSSVESTVETVKRTFDLELQVREHPLPMMAGSFLTGLAVGTLFGHRISRWRGARAERQPRNSAVTLVDDAAAPNAAPARQRPSFWHRFDEEIDKVKGLAIGYLTAAVRDLIKESVLAENGTQELSSRIDTMTDSITTKLGGEPVRGPVLHQHNGAH
jgi:ElaB/YqjD/DUF883 family membrane-anchored ribosome-binding protein